MSLDNSCSHLACVVFVSTVSFNNATYFSNPASTNGRNHLTIRRSIDNTKTWPKELLVQAGNAAGYSCLVKGALAGADASSSGTGSNSGSGVGVGGILYESTAGGINFAQFPLSLSL